jgi:hypothetical protein
MLSDLVDVGDIRSERHIFGSHTVGGSTASPLVVVDESVRIGKAVEFRQEITMIEIGSAMQDDDWRAFPNVPRVQLRTSHGDPILTRPAAPFLSNLRKGSGRYVGTNKYHEREGDLHRQKTISRDHLAQSAPENLCPTRSPTRKQ